MDRTVRSRQLNEGPQQQVDALLPVQAPDKHYQAAVARNGIVCKHAGLSMAGLEFSRLDPTWYHGGTLEWHPQVTTRHRRFGPGKEPYRGGTAETAPLGQQFIK